MQTEATIGRTARTSSEPETIAPVVHRALVRACLTAAVVLLLIAAWRVAQRDLYTSGSDVGYYLGLSGGMMMVLLLLYPLRKHVPFLREWGPLKFWFRAHMTLGIAGPLFVLFHSTFHIGSLNAAVALGCMVLVAVSGIVGRFIYRKIHHGLYGSRANTRELQEAMNRQLVELQPLLKALPQIQREVQGFVELTTLAPKGHLKHIGHFLSLGWKRTLIGRRVKRPIALAAAQMIDQNAAARSELTTLASTIDATLTSLQRAAQFTTYERLFSLWHVLHIPFVYMMVFSAIAHVVAVHMY